MELFAYIGTVLLLGSSLLRERTALHIVRIIGNMLWLVYAIHISNMPLIVTDAIAIVIDIIAIVLYRDKAL